MNNFVKIHQAVNKVNEELDTIIDTNGKLQYVKIQYAYEKKVTHAILIRKVTEG